MFRLSIFTRRPSHSQPLGLGFLGLGKWLRSLRCHVHTEGSLSTRGHGLSRLSDSGGCPDANRLAITVSMPARHRPAKLPTPTWEEQMRGSVYAVARGPLEGCMDPASVTGRRHTGKPLGQPVKALKPLLKGPYSRLGSGVNMAPPLSPQTAERSPYSGLSVSPCLVPDHRHLHVEYLSSQPRRNS